MAVTQQTETDGYYVFCTSCGFHPADAEEVAVGHADEAKAQNLASMHRQQGHRTFVVPSAWVERSTTVTRRELRG